MILCGMLDLCRLILAIVIDLFRPRAAVEAEILVLRQQIIVLRRGRPGRVPLLAVDKMVLGWVCQLFPKTREALAIARPDTVVRWYRAGFRRYWRWKSRPRWGRPGVPAKIRQLIREMSVANPLWGAPRIHGELLKLGIDIGQTSVAKSGASATNFTACRSERTANEYAAIASIPIADQVARNLLPAAGGRQLGRGPFRGGLRCDAEPQDLPPAVAHDQQPIQQPKRQRRHHKQIHRGDTICMIAQKRLPSLRRRRPPSRHILGDAGLANVDAELEQFTMNARCAPQRVGNAHLPDQLPDRSRHSGAAPTGPRLPAPVTAETCAMPSHHGIRPNDGKRFAGLRKQLADPAQNHPVDG